MTKQYHINLDASHQAKYAILPGDPGRVEKIAAYLEEPKFLSQKREYTSWIGQLENEGILVMSTGIGGASTAIAVEELYKTGVTNFIRVGTCGGMNLEVQGGDLIIATGAVRMDGTPNEYVPMEFPAVANFELTSALVTAAKNMNSKFHTGIVQCKDSFYGQHSPHEMPIGYELQNKWDAWLKANVLGSEMESSTLFIVSQILGARAATVLNVIWNQERAKKGLSDPHQHDTDLAIRTAIEAIRIDIKEQNKR
ncbi:MAG: uridine phosphorylase [Clostridiaceae bacterium]|mgnify:CR=1 FL=1|nr:uridine phosphorylase [Clostridiaceae bacterium]